MKASQIRKEFLSFFENKGHAVRPSDTLVPSDDPTLLFSTAGMVQFKKLWAGSPLSFSKATTVQKCLRAGGKGSDLENVGKTIRHHTFFEMLGNFSFGDYFKKEAIAWAWEFITQVLKMPQDKLFVSVYKDDDEAKDIWVNQIGFPEERIVRLGDADNFWGPAGDEGACGPCSEIYYDLGPERGCGSPDCMPGCDCERYLEFWNLVFPQFFQKKDGSRIPLERRGIDTGMGLERLSLLMQGVSSNYETDLFKPIIEKVSAIAGKPYEGQNVSSFNVIADHIRALVFTFSENILPSNEGRGYVLRRILRRAVRFGRKVGINEPFLYTLVPVVVKVMGQAYPELAEMQEHVSGIIKSEETRFNQTLDAGYAMMNEILENTKAAGKTTISGEDAFRLYDTYGFPVDIIDEIAQDEDMELDKKGFEAAMEKQKQAGKKSWKGTNIKTGAYAQIASKHGITKFTGYEKTADDATVVAVLVDGALQQSADGEVEIILDQTPFYAESGGQVSDNGTISCDGFTAKVTDLYKTLDGVFVHVATVQGGKAEPGAKVKASVDLTRREEIRRHHTATHILHTVLREVLGEHIKQAGSMVDEGRLRFDFSHFSQITAEQLGQIEQKVNELILSNSLVNTAVTTPDEARAQGATALFGEKYGDSVRMVSVGGFSKELCGGTHVENSGQIGAFFIVSEASVAAGIRRIEAVCGISAYKFAKNKVDTLSGVEKRLSCKTEEILPRIDSMTDEIRQISKELKDSKLALGAGKLNAMLSNPAVVGDNVKVYSECWDSPDMGQLRSLADKAKAKLDGVVILAGKNSEKVSFITLVSDELIKKGLKAGDIIKELALTTDGSGGGRPNMAQGGGKNPSKLDEALENAKKLISECVK